MAARDDRICGLFIHTYNTLRVLICSLLRYLLSHWRCLLATFSCHTYINNLNSNKQEFKINNTSYSHTYTKVFFVAVLCRCSVKKYLCTYSLVNRYTTHIHTLYLHTYIHTYIHTYVPTYIHTKYKLHAYIHNTYIHAKWLAVNIESLPGGAALLFLGNNFTSWSSRYMTEMRTGYSVACIYVCMYVCNIWMYICECMYTLP